MNTREHATSAISIQTQIEIEDQGLTIVKTEVNPSNQSGNTNIPGNLHSGQHKDVRPKMNLEFGISFLVTSVPYCGKLVTSQL